MTVLINLFGGPGVGKSTLALGLGYHLKLQGKEAAVIIEEAKPWALRGDPIDGRAQLEIASRQYAAESRYYGLVDYIITDSPMELQAFYFWMRTGWDCYKDLVIGLERHKDVVIRNLWVERMVMYVGTGRFQTDSEARDVDDRMFLFLNYLDLHPIANLDPEKLARKITR